MNKLKLNVEELSIDSFEASEKDESAGTIHGQEWFASQLNSCDDTLCGRTYCLTRSPCAC